MIELERLDHFVLTVKNVDATCGFYDQVLGMDVKTFGDGRRALHFGEQKINLHERGKEYEPKARTPMPGSADLCFITQTSPQEVIEHLKICSVAVIEGPVTRAGALGSLISVYFRDPDGNLLEVSSYAEPDSPLNVKE